MSQANSSTDSNSKSTGLNVCALENSLIEFVFLCVCLIEYIDSSEFDVISFW